MARRSNSEKRQSDSGASQNGEQDVARYEEELVGVLTERIKPGLNRGSIPLLARSIAKEIAHREHPRDASEDAEDAEVDDEFDADADVDADADDDEIDAEANTDDEDSTEAKADDEDGSERESSSDLETDLFALQEKLGEDWILYFAVRDGEAWLTAEKEDASQRIEAPNAAVLVKAVKLLNESGGRSKRTVEDRG